MTENLIDTYSGTSSPVAEPTIPAYNSDDDDAVGEGGFPVRYPARGWETMAASCCTLQTGHCTTQSAANQALHYTIRTLQTTHTTQSERCARIKVDTTQCRHHRLNCVAQNAQNALQCTHHTLDIAHLDVELHTPESLHGGKSSRLIVHFVKLREHSVLPAG